MGDDPSDSDEVELRDGGDSDGVLDCARDDGVAYTLDRCWLNA